MKTKVFGVILLGSLLWWGVAKAKSDVGNLETRLINVRFGKVSLTSLEISVQIEFNNTSNQAFYVDGVTGKVRLGNTVIGDIYHNQKIMIPARINSAQWFKVRIFPETLLGAYKYVKDIISGKTVGLGLEYNLHINGVQIPEDNTIQLSKSMLGL